MNLDEFCGSKFWDHNVTWNTPYPDLTLCFEHTVLVWIPCIFLWIMSAVQVPLLLRRKVPLPDGSTQPTLTEGTGPGNSGGPENRANSKPSVPPVPKPSGILKITQNPRIVVSCLKFFVILALLGVHVLWLVASLVTYDISNAFLTAEILRISTYLLVLLMMCIHVKKQVRSSGTIFIFWFLSAVCGVFEFQTRIREAIASDGGYDYFVLQLAMAHYIGVFSSFLFQCWADAWFPVVKNRRMISPEENASFLSRITLFWFNKLIKTGFRKTLEKGDLWEPREVDKSATQVPVFFKYWSYYRINRKTNLLRVLCRMFGPESAMGALCKLVQDCLAFVAPFVLRLLMTFVQEKDNPDSYVWHGIFFVAILFLANIFQSLFLNNYQKTMFQISMHVRTVMISAIYQKSLRISPKGRKEIDGEIVNIMTTDVLRLETTIQKLCNAWSAPLQIIVAIYLLWGILGASVLGGVVVMVLLTPVNVYVGILTRNFRVEMNKSKDKRVKLMNEILNGIKVLKLYAWEPSFEKQVESFRTEEIRIIRKQACVEIFTNFVWNCAPVLVSLVTFGTYILIDENNVLDTEKAFVALVLFKMMNLPITLLPQTFNLLAECIVSLERLNKFLNAEEMDRTAVIEDLHEADPVVIENGNFAWVEKNACLKNINVRIEPGKLVAIVGTVGSGKSSLLNAMLGEMLRVSGRVKRQGKVAYVAQQAWILNAMLQSNIVFGKNIRDSSRSYFNKVVKACALYLDIKRLPNKTLTEIGEKGVNLSGGQKQRVSLARAAFSEADLILLDDPLSAVDAHVGKHIFEELIGPKGLLKLKTRIMVTHGIAYLPQVDQIIVMKDGEISEEGTYSELMERKGAFAEYIEEHNQSMETEGREEVMSMQEELIVPEGDEDVRPSTSAAIRKTLLCDRHEGSDIEHAIHDELNEGLEQSDVMITSSELDKGTQLISNLGASAGDSMLNEVDNKPTSPKNVVINCLPTSSNTVIHDVDLKRQSRIGQEQLSPIGSRKSSMSSNDKIGNPESEELETSVNFLQTGVRKPSIDDGSPEIAGLGDSSLQNGLKRDSIISFDLEETEPCERRASGSGIQQQTICPNQSVKKRGGQKSRVVELLPDSNVGFNPPEKIIKEELMQSGNVKLNVYWDYLKSIGPLYAISGITFAILLQVFLIGSSVWLSIWSRSAKEGDAESRNWFLIIYGLIGLCQTICASIANASQSMGMIRGAQNLHRQLLRNILRSPMSFFDTTPVGRIISRFSSDVDSVDTSFPGVFKPWLLFLLTGVATVVLITVITPWTLVAVIPLGVVYYILQKVYIVTSTQLQRLESVSKSPIFSHFSETLTGCTTIRAYGAQEGFILKSEALVDSNIRCLYPTIVANVWLCLRLEMIGNLFVFFAGLFAVLGRNSLSAGSIGLSLTYAFQVTQTLSWLMKLTPLVETNAVAIERLKEYDSTPKEAPWEIPENKPDATWPESGVVSFQEYKTRYRDNLEMVLRDTSFETSAAQKIGIVGRTGAGKSSLSLALFRMIESQGGKIVIDNKNIATLGLHDVRSRITIIPQEPFLFSGTIRMNIDPFGKYSDEQIWNALEMAHLKVFVSGLDSGLDYEVTANEGSFNLSAGQQQLICLARAVLRKSKILVLDEATAAVDLSTDDLIQQTIRHEFQDSTVLTIAHRLNTIMDSDKILVLDYGHVKEFDTPANLLKQKRSIFYQLAKEAGVI